MNTTNTNLMSVLNASACILWCLILLAFSAQQAGSQPARVNPAGDAAMIEVTPVPYTKGLRNPLMGFTTRGIYDHPWATTAHTYIQWSEIENDESDGIEKIRAVTDEKWKDIAARNIKIIPRVYLHWNDGKNFWPADMKTGDYSSKQFQQRVVRLIERLGILWDNDPRVAFVEMGLFGKWGEQEQPFPTESIQVLVADAFAKAFRNKLVSVRRNWEICETQLFGVYWDSWAHYDQMWKHGNRIAQLNAAEGRYLKTYVGGEVAYWGDAKIQPGPDPTANVAEEKHRNFVINSIRWLHCTQFRWIENYDQKNAKARAGADLIQQALGYRYMLERVAFSRSVKNGTLRVELGVKNVGSAPFYYDWPLEVSLLNPADRSVVWKQPFRGVNIRDWLPGAGWTAPEWKDDKPNPKWMEKGTPAWKIPPKTYLAGGDFKPNVPPGRYILALAILDPAGNLPSVRFATRQYFKGGRHPVGIVAVGGGDSSALPADMVFDELASDQSLHYVP